MKNKDLKNNDKKDKDTKDKDTKDKDLKSKDMKSKDKTKPVEEKKNYEELWDKYVRLGAEFDNYKKRSFKEKIDFMKYANEGLIVELLSILDNFERGIKSAESKKDYNLLHQGVDMISKQLHSLLETKGLSRIKSIGQKFDPHQHEAVEVVEGDDEGEVIEELQSGYLLSGRIIRPARVKVIKAKQMSEENVDNQGVKEDTNVKEE
ncbi:MAG: nucleotide exchange factor GrpE [Candidatus Omnitrophica bacterium]|nr:nucleotide exchange factor GrpE [Candidatus Omnitrophota bacterium]